MLFKRNDINDKNMNGVRWMSKVIMETHIKIDDSKCHRFNQIISGMNLDDLFAASFFRV